MNTCAKIFVVVIALALAGAAVWFLGRGHRAATSAKDSAPAAATTRPALPIAAVPPAPEPPPKPLAPQQEAEEAATARMYLAHAPLRVPEVADPDSATNRQILQTMVGKALGISAPPAPKVPSTP